MREYCPDTGKPCKHCIVGCEEQVEQEGERTTRRLPNIRKVTRYVLACSVCGREDTASAELRGRKVRGMQDAWSCFYSRGWNRMQGDAICPACSRED